MRKNISLVPDYTEIRFSDALGRLYSENFTNIECYCIRILLNAKKTDQRIHLFKPINAHICETYREAGETLRLIKDNNQWELAMYEATLFAFPDKFRGLM